MWSSRPRLRAHRRNGCNLQACTTSRTVSWWRKSPDDTWNASLARNACQCAGRRRQQRRRHDPQHLAGLRPQLPSPALRPRVRDSKARVSRETRSGSGPEARHVSVHTGDEPPPPLVPRDRLRLRQRPLMVLCGSCAATTLGANNHASPRSARARGEAGRRIVGLRHSGSSRSNR